MAKSEYTDEPEIAADAPPSKRLRMTLTLDAHDLWQLCDELRRIANDVELEDREERSVTSGAGYHFYIEVRDPSMTPERFNAELESWIKRRTADRFAQPSESCG